MKNLFAALTVLLTVTSASAFFNGNNSWNDNSNVDDNGIFAYNSYDYFDPRWFSQEFTNMVTEMDDEFSNDNNRTYAYGRGFPAVDTTK